MPDRQRPPWTLYRGAELIADLVVAGRDFPWLNARVRPRDGFDDVRPLFAEELGLLDDLDQQPDAWEAAYQAIRAVLTLKDPDGREVPEFLLHVDGDEAWWRWSDEPFRNE